MAIAQPIRSTMPQQGMRMELRAAQTLAMTPQLQQAIKLLQLNNLELAALIAEEAEQNPLLETDGPEQEDDFDFAGKDERNSSDADDAVFGKDNETFDYDVDNVFNNNSASDGDTGNISDLGPSLGSWDEVGNGGGAYSDDYDALQNVSDTPHLRDHLVEQITLDLHDAGDRLIAMVLLDQLDEAGYFQGNLDDITIMLGAAPGVVESVLQKCQQFDPPGIFARNLKECLSLQLQDKFKLHPGLVPLLENLELLGQHSMAKLAKNCQIDDTELQRLIGLIKLCNPKPALAFDFTPVNAVTPDILVRQNKDGSFIVELNPDTLPKALVNQTYYQTVTSSARSRQEKDYITERFHAANFLVKALHQRATTIMKVSAEILRRQELFFAEGVSGLKPMTLKDVAEAIDMHESTISRVTTNKFMNTPRGMFELKYFFSSKLASSHGGADHSAESVRQRIKQLIDKETPLKPLSDDQLVIHLQAEGIEVARRTVAKYRESLKIPSSFDRKRRAKA